MPKYVRPLHGSLKNCIENCRQSERLEGQDSQRALTTRAHTSLSTWLYKLNEEDPDFQDVEPGSVLWGSVSVLSWGLKVGSWLSYILRPHINPHVDSLFLFFLRTTTYFVRKTKANVQEVASPISLKLSWQGTDSPWAHGQL